MVNDDKIMPKTSTIVDVETLKCQILPESAIFQASAVMAKALQNNPAFTYIFQGDSVEYRERALQWLFHRHVSLMVKKCPSALRGVIIPRNNTHSNDENDDKDYDSETEVDGTVIAAFLWTPTPHQKISALQMIMAGLWELPIRFGFNTLKRFFEIADMMSEDEKMHYRDHERSFIMLERMAVLPDYQGKGLGSMCLKHVINEINITTNIDSSSNDEDFSICNSHKEVRLATQEPRNVKFYERLGFKVVGEEDYCQSSADYKFHTWYLILESSKKISE